jgi:glycosyltransferase involved in cell wall biosynthesis
MKRISVVTICYNEEGNIREFYDQVVAVFAALRDRYEYEIIIADNASTDRTPDILREIAAEDRDFKVIFNARNFGPNRSGNNAFMQAHGDAAILMSSDLQDPPAMISELIAEWEGGKKVVVAVKSESAEPRISYFLRTAAYATMDRLSDIKVIPHFTGFGLYDRQVLEIYQGLRDPYPFFRGLISDIGFEHGVVQFSQPTRKHGKSKSNLPYLYEEAMLGITSYTRLPLRLATLLGFVTAFISLLIGAFYLVYKLVYWSSFSVGMAPLAIGLFFFSAIQLIFLGLIGEYISMIYIQVLRRPPVYEKERLNF